MVGIVSWGYHNSTECLPEYPMGFANVAKFTNWIYEKMLEDYMTDLPIRVKFSSTIFEISVTVTNASGIRSVGRLYSHMGAHFEAL